MVQTIVRMSGQKIHCKYFFVFAEKTMPTNLHVDKNIVEIIIYYWKKRPCKQFLMLAEFTVETVFNINRNLV